MLLKKIGHYVNPATMFRKSDARGNFNLRAMHTINRISIFVFLFCVVVMIIRALN
jgi:hypothetical protein